MKKMKNLFSLVLTLVMVMAMGMTAMATEFGEVEGSDADVWGHSYKAYQIFSGTQSEATGAALGNVEWGSAIVGVGYDLHQQVLDALAEIKEGDVSPFADCIDAQDVANVLSNNVVNEPLVLAAAKAFYSVLDQTYEENEEKQKYLDKVTSTDLQVDSGNGAVKNAGDLKGYYLIVDMQNVEGGKDAVKNLAMLQLTGKGNFVIKKKTDIPSVEKKVDDVNDSTETKDEKNWQDSADYDIGDAVPFRLTGTLPQDYDVYDKYAFTFHDTQSAGLTFNPGSVVVKVVTKNGVEYTVTGGYTVKSTLDGNAENKPDDGCTFEIVIEDVGNLQLDGAGASYEIANGDKIVVEYTAMLNENAVINNVGNPNTVYLQYSNNPNGEGTGKTTEDKVTVFTFELDVNKKDSEKKDLAGAGFTLEKWIPDDDSTDGYDKGKWESIKVFNPDIDGALTKFSFKGIDDGFYRLTESTTPAGYNTIDPIYFKVTAEHDVKSSTPALSKLTFTQTDEKGVAVEEGFTGAQINFTVTLSNEAAAGNTDILNQRGIVLPETGGIGTTIFYVAGIVLVIIAGVLLVTKKRMSKEQ